MAADRPPRELWALPFLIDMVLGRFPEYPWLVEPGFPWIERPAERRQGQVPTPFAQYLAYEPVIPFEESPLDAKSLASLIGPTGGVTVALGVLGGHPIIIVLVPAGIILCSAARGIAEALRIGLRARLLRLMGVPDPDDKAKDDDA